MEMSAEYNSVDKSATGPDVRPLTVLGLETSCDETAASVVRLNGGRAEVLSSVVHSQIDDHAAYGGVVPEIAARSHVEMITDVTRRAMAEADMGYDGLDGIAATAGPGLVGGVMVGLSFGKGSDNRGAEHGGAESHGGGQGGNGGGHGGGGGGGGGHR